MPSRFLNNIRVNDSYTLPSADGDANQIIQTDGEGQLSFVDLSSIEGAASNFVYFEVKNETGSTINKGKGVMAVGTDGNSGHILIDEMIADGSVEAKYFLGVLETTVANGGFARVISFGQLDQFNTLGQNGETWSDGDILWCDPANDGDFTITEPDGPNVKIAAAFILNSSTNGKIQVRVQANEGIHDLHDTRITSQVDGDVLVWNNTDGVWFNDSTLNVDYTAGKVGIGTDTPQEKLHIYSTGAGAVRAEIESTQAADAILKYTNSIGSYATFLTQNGNFSIYDYNAASHRFYMLTNGNIGIGTTFPSSKLEVAGDTTEALLTLKSNNGGANDSFMRFYDESEGNSYSVGLDSSDEKFKIAYNIDGNSLTTGTRLVLDTLGNVGIGTTSPTALLTLESSSTSPYPGIDIKSTSTYPSGEIRFLDSSGSEVSTIESWSNPAISYLQLNHGYTTAFSSTLTLDDGFLYLSTAGSERMRITNTGNVGIGITNPQTKLHLGKVSSSASTIEELRIETGTSGGFAGEAKLWLKNGQYGVSTIGLGPQDGTGNPTTYIKYEDFGNKFYITTNSSARIFIDSSGNVGVGTLSTSYKLDVLGDGRFTNGTHGTVHLGNYGQNISSNYGYIQTSNSLRVNGSVKVSNDTNTPSSSNVGSIRYRTSGNNSYVDMCMQTGASSYAWVNIVTNNW